MDNKWLNSLATMSYGIYILTTAHSEKINGMVASWVSQVSFDPALLTIAVHSNRYSHDLIEKSGVFTLHSLLQDHKELIKHFKGPDSHLKFKNIEWSKGKTGCPILKDCLGYMECKVLERYSPGNHTIFLGEVINAGIGRYGNPLTTLDYDGSYLGNK